MSVAVILFRDVWHYSAQEHVTLCSVSRHQNTDYLSESQQSSAATSFFLHFFFLHFFCCNLVGFPRQLTVQRAGYR